MIRHYWAFVLMDLALVGVTCLNLQHDLLHERSLIISIAGVVASALILVWVADRHYRWWKGRQKGHG